MTTGIFQARRRETLRALLAAAGLPLAARAQEGRPTTIVVPFTPGTTPDVLARTIAPKLMQRLGQPVVVENRVGASGNIGTAYVANAAPDGHTLLMTASTIATNASTPIPRPATARRSTWRWSCSSRAPACRSCTSRTRVPPARSPTCWAARCRP
ncbi:hypothetical protein GCM10028796_37070 [Ramlibacter monticola]